eukprot:SAG31_NODE_8648_length_1414_cov_1.313308_3_plen_125_part_00
MPSFYIRVHGLGLAEVGTWLGIGTGIVAGVAGIFGGLLVDSVYKKTMDTKVWLGLSALSVALSIPINITSLLISWPHLSLALQAMTGGVASLAPCGQNAAQMAVVPSSLRATTTGMYEVSWTAA